MGTPLTRSPTRLVEVNGHRAAVHVKTKGSWQLGDIDKFVGATTEPIVFVELTETGPEFFILDGDDARAIVKRDQEQWLKRVGGVRPKTPDSKHAAVNSEHVEPWRNRWSLFD